VRSHAKASSAGSNSDRGPSLGSLCRPGAFAVLVLAVVAACFAPASALAAKTHVFKEAFGSAEQPSFTNPEGLAVDQSSGDLLVIDPGAGTVSRFNPDGTPAEFSALGTNKIEGLSFGFGGPGEVQVAVDNSGGATDGDIYVPQVGAKAVDVFGEDGSPLGQLTEYNEGPAAEGLPHAFNEPCGVAVDPSGNVYVGDFSGQIHKFEPAANPAVNADSSANFPFEGNCTLAAGAGPTAGFIFPAHYLGSVPKLDSTSGEEKYVVDPGSNTTVTVDPASGHVYTASGSEVHEYDASGAVEATLLSSFSGSGEVTGIAVDKASGEVYVARSGSSQIEVWGPAVTVPGVTTEAPTGITANKATLNGAVNPEGLAVTECKFEYGTTPAYGSTKPCEGAIPTDSSDHSVSAALTGLTPDTTYHFRLVVANAEGTFNGLDRTLTTRRIPSISAQSAEAVGFTDATLSAKINPEGEETTYHVEYGTTASYGQSTPESAPIGFEGDDTDHTVSVHIGGLTPATAYHFRFVATSPAATVKGTDASFATYPTTPGLPPCPNDAFRSGFGAALPDCRAYEQATPTDKHGANIQGSVNLVQASSAGDRITFYLNGGLPTSGGSSTLSAFMASRGATGWSSDSLLAPTDPGLGSFVAGWSEDLSTTAVTAPGPGNVGEAVYLRDSATAAFQLSPAGAGHLERVFVAGFAADTSHLIFETKTALAPGAVEGKINLYDLDHGSLTLAGRIPAGSATSCDDAGGPACEPAPEGSVAGPYGWSGGGCTAAGGGASCGYYTQNTISRDGSRVFFTALGSAQLYMREDGTATTQVSASQRTVPDPDGEKPAAFVVATPDGSKVFFLSCAKLTDDSTAVSTVGEPCVNGFRESHGQDLYSYDTGSGELTDLSVDSNVSDALGADVQGVLGISDDGSYVYFAANGELAEGASPGNPNLYVSHNGTVTHIASLNGSDSRDWQPFNGAPFEPKTSRVTPDGHTLLFSSYQSLTGYDNVTPVADVCGGGSGNPCQELFRYSAPSEELTCVSCNPTGVPPSGNTVLGSGRTLLAAEPNATFLTRNLSADGNRVFFDSPDPLLPSDTNGVKDVYEWEAKGSGSCESESQDGGCIYLLSSGTSPDPSYFADASADGDHALLFTDQQLVPTDHDQLVDVYDAGVGGGLAAQHALAPPTCSATACQANPPPPPDQGTASSVFSGPGNAHKRPAARKCPKGKRKVRRAGKVSCQKASRHQQSKHKRHNNRGGSK
jgi:hypothetical protein